MRAQLAIIAGVVILEAIALRPSSAQSQTPQGLDRLEAAVSVSSAAKQSESIPLRNDPPAILVSTVPAMLILVDGSPEFRALPAKSVERVIDTRPLLLRQKGGNGGFRTAGAGARRPGGGGRRR